MEKHNFGEYYRTISNAELVSVLDNPSGYQPQAIEAAKDEFSARLLSEEEISIARQEILVKQFSNEKQSRKLKDIEEGVKGVGLKVFESINPLDSEVSPIQRRIRLICIAFTCNRQYLIGQQRIFSFLGPDIFSRCRCKLSYQLLPG